MKEAARDGISGILNTVRVPFEKVRERPSQLTKSGPGRSGPESRCPSQKGCRRVQPPVGSPSAASELKVAWTTVAFINDLCTVVRLAGDAAVAAGPYLIPSHPR